MVPFFKKHRFWFTFFIMVHLSFYGSLYFKQVYFINPSEQHFRYLFTASNILLSTIFYTAFVQSYRIKNQVNYISQPKQKSQLRHNHIFYTVKNKCQRDDDRYKAPRMAHCSKDGCAIRFDHHCPWTNNCVGYFNHKAYIVFTMSGFLFSVEFTSLSIRKYITIVSTQVNPMSQNQTSIWVLLTITNILFALFLFGLTLNALLFQWKNVTYIELLKGTFKFNDSDGINPNPFDLQLTTNFANFFQGQLWTFWLPTTHVPKYDGTKFAMVPVVTQNDKKSLYQNIRQCLKDPIQKTIPETYEQLYQRESAVYKNTIFHYLGEEYTLDGPIQKQKDEEADKQQLSNKEGGKQESKEISDILADVYAQDQ